jgi:His-Xaa-Ser repeat protein HxsA
MKHLVLFSSLLGAFSLAAPATGLSRDHHHHGSSSHCDSHHSYRCGPSVSYNCYRPSYYSYRPAYYGSYYGSPYGYYPYSYYSAPSVAFTYTSTPTYYRGSRADYGDGLAVDVQRALSRRGFYRGAIDGDVGPGTRGAIREYQYRNGLEVTGRIDRSLLRSLGLS